MGGRGKDEVLPQPDGSILSGGTVASNKMTGYRPRARNCDSLVANAVKN